MRRLGSRGAHQEKLHQKLLDGTVPGNVEVVLADEVMGAHQGKQ